MELDGLQPLVQALGWALVHFIWQGAVIGVLFAAGKLLLRHSRPQSRYLLGLGCMLLMLLAPVITFMALFQAGQLPAQTLATPVAPALAPLAPAGFDFAGWIENALPWVVLIWLAGVVVMSGRVSLNWYRLYRCLRIGVRDLDEGLQQRAEQLRVFFGIRRRVQVLESVLVQVPTVFGWLKPVVLLPTSSLVGLTPAQLELVIAHELGHIRRFDYVVNLFQVSVETLLFYHPVVAWISRHVRQEREQCCDDLVVKTCGNRLEYAKALTNLESIRATGGMSPALAATDGHLRQRIERIVCAHGRPRDPMLGSSGVLLLVAAAIILGGRMADPMAAFEAKRNLLADTLVSELFSGDGAELFAPLEEARISIASIAPAAEPALPAATESIRRPSAEVADAKPFAQAPAVVEPTAAPVDAGRPAEPTVTRRSTSLAVDPPGSPILAERPRPSAVLGEPPLQLAALPKQADFSAPARPDPLAIERVSPDYPVRARIAGLQGYVELEFSLRPDGRVTEVQVSDSWPRRVFDRAAIKAIRGWRFDPGSLADHGETRLTQRFDFNIGQGALLSRDKHDCPPVTGTRICRPESPTSLLSQEAHVD